MRFAECHPERKHHAKGMCVRCYLSKWERERYASDPVFRAKQREDHLLRAYNMTLLDFDNMLAKQAGKCALCGMLWDPLSGQNALAVDHDHITGRVRGLLCKFCNGKLGWFENRRELIERYIA